MAPACSALRNWPIPALIPAGVNSPSNGPNHAPPSSSRKARPRYALPCVPISVPLLLPESSPEQPIHYLAMALAAIFSSFLPAGLSIPSSCVLFLPYTPLLPSTLHYRAWCSSITRPSKNIQKIILSHPPLLTLFLINLTVCYRWSISPSRKETIKNTTKAQPSSLPC